MFARLRQDIREMFTELRDYRELLFTMTRRDLVLRYRKTVMGFGWAIFMPVMNTIVFTMIFRRVAKIETDVPYPVFSYCGLLPWNLFATSLKTGLNSLVSNKSLLTKVYFPREVFPFSTMLVCVVDFVVGLSILALLMLYYRIPLSYNRAVPSDSGRGAAHVHGWTIHAPGTGEPLLPRRQVHTGRPANGLDVCNARGLSDATGDRSARAGSPAEPSRTDY